MGKNEINTKYVLTLIAIIRTVAASVLTSCDREEDAAQQDDVISAPVTTPQTHAAIPVSTATGINDPCEGDRACRIGRGRMVYHVNGKTYFHTTCTTHTNCRNACPAGASHPTHNGTCVKISPDNEGVCNCPD